MSDLIAWAMGDDPGLDRAIEIVQERVQSLSHHLYGGEQEVVNPHQNQLMFGRLYEAQLILELLTKENE